jgi:LmbE family N-acetylglucosaminyl deacetylase
MERSYQEQQWQNFLKKLPEWIPPATKAVILSPHPDDETLGAGGLIADLRHQKIDVTILAVTNGENAYLDMKDLGEIRKNEQVAAASNLGVCDNHIIRFNLTDSAVSCAEEELVQLTSPFIDEQTHLIAPWTGDFHPDHEVVGRVAAKVAKRMGAAALSFYFFWTWHRANVSAIRHLPLGLYPLKNKAYSAKQKALSCYSSQLTHDPEPILSSGILAPAKRTFEVYCHYEK